MKALTVYKLLIIACTFFFSEEANAVPIDYEAVYSVKLMQADGTLRAKLEKNEEVYTYSLKTEPTGFWKLIANGSINESSAFEIIDNEIRPINYKLIDTIRRNPRESIIDFDWSKKVIKGFYKDRTIDLKLEESILTRVLLQIEIMHQKQNNGMKDSYLIIDRDEIKEIDISSSNSKRKISVPFGSYDVIEVSHRSRNSNRINTFWLAPELDFIPIKLEQTENNKVNFEANLVQLTR
ncbi:MAG TPA: DUF3108 domain-containing protein [Gammaproteobacteria bacterium]|nr:DUF3108 domain-containing protein [Gammaproteobacteria bacterium]